MGGKAARALGFGNHLFYGIIILSDTPGRFADTAGFRGAKKWWWTALICTAASVAGGILGWGIGHLAWSGLQDFFYSYVPGFTKENFEYVQNLYQDNAFMAILGAALTPIPYKLFTIAAGVCNVDLATLVFASILGRGGRFLQLRY